MYRRLAQNGMLLAFVVSVITGCQTVTVNDYADYEPPLTLAEFFSGDLRAEGVVKNFRGKVIRTFTADINAYWNTGIGTLEEDFLFNDGEKQRRVWTLTPDAHGGYTGTADDVIGAGKVTVAGNSAFLNYVLRVPYGDGTIDLRIDDRMYLTSTGLLINESTMRKFGFKVGEIVLTIFRV